MKLSIQTLLLLAAVGISCFAVQGCALKPLPEHSGLVKQSLGNVAVPAQWGSGASMSGPVAGDWIKTLNEQPLDALIEETLARNADLHIAATRIEQAEAALKIAGASLLPAVDALGRSSKKFKGGGDTNLTGVFLNASWELDLWGRLRYGQRAAASQYDSAQADYEFARMSLAATVARSWFVAAESTLQRKLAQDMLVSAERLAELAKTRVRVGSANEVDAARADADVQSYRISLRQLDLAREQALRALEILAGRYPAATLPAAETLPWRLIAWKKPRRRVCHVSTCSREWHGSPAVHLFWRIVMTRVLVLASGSPRRFSTAVHCKVRSRYGLQNRNAQSRNTRQSVLRRFTKSNRRLQTRLRWPTVTQRSSS